MACLSVNIIIIKKFESKFVLTWYDSFLLYFATGGDALAAQHHFSRLYGLSHGVNQGTRRKRRLWQWQRTIQRAFRLVAQGNLTRPGERWFGLKVYTSLPTVRVCYCVSTKLSIS